MGQEIVYCAKCATRLLTSDFEKGRAFRLGNRVACRDCAPAMGVSAEEVKLASQKTPSSGTQLPKFTSSTRVRAYVPAEGTPRAGTRKLEAPKSAVPLVAGVLVGVGVLAAVIAGFVFTGTPSAPPPEAPKVGVPPPPEPPAGEDSKTRGARRLYDEAYAYARANPGDLEGQVTRYAAVMKEALGTPVYPAARDAHDALLARRMKELPREIERLADEARPHLERENFKAAIEVYEKARARRGAPEWPGLLEGKVREARQAAQRALGAVKEKAAEAKRKGQAEDLKRARERVAGWGIPELAAELEKHLTGIAEPRPATPEELAYLGRWKDAMARAAARDFEGAVAILQKEKLGAADAEDLRRAGALRRELLGAWARVAPGTALDVGLRDGKRMTGRVVAAGSARIELEEGWLELEDVAAKSLLERAAPSTSLGTSGADAKTVAILLTLDGEGPFDIAQGKPEEVLPERYGEFARGVKPSPPSARELEARKLVYEAERQFRADETWHVGVEKFRRLVAEFADTRAVGGSDLGAFRRRAEAGRDYVFLADAFQPAGEFRTGSYPKAAMAWTMAADVEPREGLRNYLEVEFAALPGVPYKAWVWAGGCCVETFTFYVQASELQGPQKVPCGPGDNHSHPVKLAVPFLKTTHQAHGGGAREAKRWDWVALPLPPKFAEGGRKSIRILAERQGFAAGAVVVSATRPQPPAEAELRAEIEKLRGAEGPDESLVGWWKLDESPADASGRGAALKGPLAWGSGRMGGGLAVDGAAGREFGAPNFAHEGNEITLAAWVRHEGLPPDRVMRYVTVGPDVAVIRHNAKSRNLHFYIRLGSDLRHVEADNVLAQGRWHHVAGTWDGRTMRLWLDGRPIAEAAQAGSLPAGTKGVRLSLAPEPLHGDLDDVRVYDRALGPEEIRALAGLAFRPPVSRGPVGWWKLDEGAADSAGGLHGQGSGKVAWGPGKLSGALGLSGGGEHVAVPHAPALELPGDFTVGFWVKKNAESPEWVRLVGKGAGDRRDFGVWEEPGGSKRILFQQYGPGVVLEAYSLTPIEAGQWYHVACLVRDNVGEIYINGGLEARVARSGLPAVTPEPLMFGAGIHAGFSGWIDDVRLWARALSAKEVLALAAAGGVKPVAAPVAPEKGTPVAPGMEGWWKFDDGTAKDASGMGRDGVLRGSAAGLGGALSTGGRGGVLVGPFGSFTRTTVAAWVNRSGGQGGRGSVVSYKEDGGDGCVLCVNEDGSNPYPRFWVMAGGAWKWAEVKEPVPEGRWVHLAGTYDGAAIRLYVDGRLQATEAAPGEMVNARPQGLGIGMRSTQDMHFFAGQVDDVRLFSRALSDAEVAALAVRAAEAGWKPVFDGKTLGWLNPQCHSGWKAEGGVLVQLTDNAAQTVEQFGDAEVRVRFEVEAPVDRLWFAFRQNASDGFYHVGWTGRDVDSLPGKVRELLISGKGDQVTASLDGRPLAVEVNGKSRRGALQFNARAKSFRVLSIESRDVK